MNNLKRKGIRIIASLAAAAALAGASGCDEYKNPIDQTEVPAVTATLSPTMKPTPTPTATPEPTPTLTPTPTPLPTPTFDPLGLNSYEDVFNEEVVAHEAQKIYDLYLNTTFTRGLLSASEEELKNIISWRGVPTGKIDEDNFMLGFDEFEWMKQVEMDRLSDILRGERTVDGEIVIMSLEPLFINGSYAENLYFQLYEKEKNLYNNFDTEKGLELAQETVNYINEIFVESDLIFENIDNPYDRFWILFQISQLYRTSARYKDEIFPTTGTIKYADVWEYMRIYMDKRDKHFEEYKNEIIQNAKEAKNTLKLD